MLLASAAAMSSIRSGPVALVLGAAAWAQLSLAPAVARGSIDAVSLAFAAAAAAALGAAAAVARRAPERAATLGIAVFPSLVGLSAFVSGREVVPRFDAPSRALAALTAVAGLAAAARWRGELATRVPVATAPDDRPLPATRRLQQVSLAALTLLAAAVAVVGPALLGAREPDGVAERLAGEGLVRGRGAMVSAVGTLLALAIVLQGGSSLLRAEAPRARAPSRALAYGLWALCAFIMRRWLDQAR